MTGYQSLALQATTSGAQGLTTRLLQSDIITVEVSIGVAAIATALLGATFVSTRRAQILDMAESLEKDDIIRRLDRLNRLLVLLLVSGTLLCTVCLMTLVFPNEAFGIGGFGVTLLVLAVGLEVGRRLTK